MLLDCVHVDCAHTLLHVCVTTYPIGKQSAARHRTTSTALWSSQKDGIDVKVVKRVDRDTLVSLKIHDTEAKKWRQKLQLNVADCEDLEHATKIMIDIAVRWVSGAIRDCDLKEARSTSMQQYFDGALKVTDQHGVETTLKLPDDAASRHRKRRKGLPSTVASNTEVVSLDGESLDADDMDEEEQEEDEDALDEQPHTHKKPAANFDRPSLSSTKRDVFRAPVIPESFEEMLERM